jgi:site-specific DNA-cytosine methylase
VRKKKEKQITDHRRLNGMHVKPMFSCNLRVASAADVEKLPLPGEVDLIVGGPPCQVRGQKKVQTNTSALAECM